MSDSSSYIDFPELLDIDMRDHRSVGSSQTQQEDLETTCEPSETTSENESIKTEEQLLRTVYDSTLTKCEPKTEYDIIEIKDSSSESDCEPFKIKDEPAKIVECQSIENKNKPSDIEYQPLRTTNEIVDEQIKDEPSVIAYQPLKIEDDPSVIAYQPLQIKEPEIDFINEQPLEVGEEATNIKDETPETGFGFPEATQFEAAQYEYEHLGATSGSPQERGTLPIDKPVGVTFQPTKCGASHMYEQYQHCLSEFFSKTLYSSLELEWEVSDTEYENDGPAKTYAKVDTKHPVIIEIVSKLIDHDDSGNHLGLNNSFLENITSNRYIHGHHESCPVSKIRVVKQYFRSNDSFYPIFRQRMELVPGGIRYTVTPLF